MGEARTGIGERIAAALIARDADEKTLTKQRTAFLRVPYVVAVTTRSGKDLAETTENRDAVAAAIQNMLLAGTALGLATIWRTGALVTEPAVRDYLALAADEEIVGYVCVSYPASEPAPRAAQTTDTYTRWLD